MPLRDRHSDLVASVSDPRTHAQLQTALKTEQTGERLALASSIARAAQSCGEPSARPAWRFAVDALRTLAPALRVRNSKTAAPAAVEAYAALYSLAVAEDPKAAPEEVEHAQSVAAEALRRVLASSAKQKRGRPRAVRDDVHTDGAILDRTLFPGAAGSGWDTLMPSSGSPATVVIPALIARIRCGDASLSERINVSRAMLIPWLKSLPAGPVVDAYRRKARAALLAPVPGEQSGPEDLLRSRTAAVSLFPGGPHEYAKTVHRAANQFLRSSAKRDYAVVASVYEDAIAFFTRLEQEDTDFRSAAAESEDVLAWFDHAFVTYSSVGTSRSKRLARDLAKAREDILEDSPYFLVACAQTQLVDGCLYDKTLDVIRKDQYVRNAVGHGENAMLLVKGSKETSQGTVELRLLRILEPVRAAVCVDKKVRTLSPANAALLSLYVNTLLSARSSNRGDGFVQSRLLAMVPAAMGACEQLLRVNVFANKFNGIEKALADCLALAKDVRDTTSDVEAVQWAKWLSVMLNNLGVEVYNLYSRNAEPDARTTLYHAATFLRESAKWQRLAGSPRGQKRHAEEKECMCYYVPGPVASSYAVRLALSADAFLASGPDHRDAAVRVALKALHTCCASEMVMPQNVPEALGRAAIACTQKDTSSFWDAVGHHVSPNGMNEADTVFLRCVLFAIQAYGVSSRRRHKGLPMRRQNSYDGNVFLRLVKDICDRLIADTEDCAHGDLRYCASRVQVLLGDSEGLQEASGLTRQLSSLSHRSRSRQLATYVTLSKTWVSIEGLDPSKLSALIGSLSTELANLGDLRKSSVWDESNQLAFHILELAEWGSYVLSLQAMDQLALELLRLVDLASSKLELPSNLARIADAYRRLGLLEQCWTSIGVGETRGGDVCVGVHGRTLVDLSRFDDAESVVDRHPRAECREVLADAVVLGRGDVSCGMDSTKASLKELTRQVVNCERPLLADAASVRLAGVELSTCSDVLDVLSRAHHDKLLSIARCASRMGDLNVRIGSIKDALYYASKAREISGVLDAHGAHALYHLQVSSTPTLFNTTDHQVASDGDLQVDFSKDFTNFASTLESVNSITAIRIRLGQGAELLSRCQFESFLLADVHEAMSFFDDAGHRLDSLESCGDVNDELVCHLSGLLHYERAGACLLLEKPDESLALLKAAESALTPSREELFKVVVREAEVCLRMEYFVDGCESIQRAFHILQDGAIGSSSLLRKFWGLAADLEMLNEAVAGPYDRKHVVKCLMNAHGTSFEARRGLTDAGDSVPEFRDVVGALQVLSLEEESEPKCLVPQTPRGLSSESYFLVGLGLSFDKTHLVVWRVANRAGSSLYGVVRRPLPKSSKLSVKAVQDRFQKIQDDMKRMPAGDKSFSREEKTSWWKERFALDHALGELMADVEEHWIGPARALLLPATLDESASATFDIMNVSHDFDSADDALPAESAAAMLRFPEVVSDSDVSSLLQEAYSTKERTRSNSKLTNLLRDLDLLCQSREKKASESRPRTRGAFSRRTRSSGDSDDAAANLHKCTSTGHLSLAIGTDLEWLPWESLPVLRASKAAVSRIPHASYLPPDGVPVTVDSSKVFYLLNPSGDLDSTQSTFQDRFERRSGWHGVSGADSAATDVDGVMSSLTVSDVFLYCGHGGGEAFVPPRRLARAGPAPVSLLMGCSSGRLERYTGDVDSDGTALEYLLAGAPAVVANLWDVSDRDIDRLTVDLLDRWLPDAPKSGKKKPKRRDSDELPGHESAGIEGDRESLACALARARDACRLPYLVGAATVIYGRGDVFSR